MFNKVQKTVQAGIALIFVFVLGWGTVSPAHAATIRYVKWDAAGANNGKSWANAYTDLQTALNAAPSGTEIWVAAGTYTPSVDNRGASFVLKNGVSIYGGFAGTETQRSQRKVGANLTILSGDIGVLDDPSDNSYHVVLARSVNTSAVLDGFTITKGNASNEGSLPFSGGGILVKFGSTPTLVMLTITENTAYDSGGGLASYDDSSPRLTKIKFLGNAAVGGGGGMYSLEGSPVLDNVIFDGNQANTGGGLFTASDYSVLTNVTFSNNTATLNGGGLANSNGYPNLTNVTFSGNAATRNGGGMSVDYFSEPVLTNVTFTGNTADVRGGALAITNNSKPSIVNSIFWDDSASERPEILVSGSEAVVSKSVIQDGCPPGTTCKNIVTKDPLLDLLGDYGGFTQTVPLLEDSSAIDTGDDANCPKTDQRGLSRPQGSHCDIGAFESGSPGVPILKSPANDAVVGSFQPTLTWNPSNPDVISYDLQVSTNVTFNAIVIDETDIPNSWYKPSFDLDPSVRYYWRVRAVNIDGEVSGWSSVRSFRTPLEAPTLVSPDPLESFTTDRVTFTWNPVPLANRYVLQVSATANFSGLVLSTIVDGTEFTTVQELPQNKTLYWRVAGKTSLVVGLWSEKRAFTSGNPPSVPVLVTPAKGALVKDFTPTLNWQNSALPKGSTFKQYEVQVDDDNDFSSPINGVTTLNDLTDSDFTPGANLDSNTRYYWRVRAVNIFNAQDHTSAWSRAWSFNTAIAAPTSLTVVPTGNPLQPGFDWDDATGQGKIKSYTIQISTNSNFTTLFVSATRSISEYSLIKNLPSGKTIFWRVRVNGENGPSAWSTDSFTTP